ncbi:MAG: hypothetical protein OXU22_04715, partial [Gammaproteobacteria bacterium]|nr:hypothetical protein [Gammaproteobacteria bacterium]
MSTTPSPAPISVTIAEAAPAIDAESSAQASVFNALLFSRLLLLHMLKPPLVGEKSVLRERRMRGKQRMANGGERGIRTLDTRLAYTH